MIDFVLKTYTHSSILGTRSGISFEYLGRFSVHRRASFWVISEFCSLLVKGIF